ncbi:sialidase family protein [Rosistilla oblonga]|uniref:Sialidase n=1 Tax=Rosistilla oblonga TaxID=2527990 RepID=A0A518ISV4_9BACT|nr:sialidase family protein [Rosistilla oblonga]QDV56168.1 Sialidase precursor [Rosistilla oblonga]
MLNRRNLIKAAAGWGGACALPGIPANSWAKSYGEDRPLLRPVFDQVICPETAEHPRNDHQTILPLDSDRLMLVWSEYYLNAAQPSQRGGNARIGDEVSCQISSMISSDRGRTWGDRRVLQPNEWKHNVKQSNLVRLSENELLMFYVGWDSATDRNVFRRRSFDNGQTWDAQVQISQPGWYCNNADRAIRLSTGRILLPAHGPYDPRYIGGTRYKGGDLHSFVYYSDDGFQTWKTSKNSMTAQGRGCHEPTIVELKDGSLYCLMRNTNKTQYASRSTDGGETWSTPEPTVLISPESPALLKRIPSTGDLMVIWNNVSSSSNWPRNPLSIAISDDEAKTWKHVQDIDNRNNFEVAYPSATFVDDEVLIAYYSRPTRGRVGSEVTLRIYKTDQLYT